MYLAQSIEYIKLDFLLGQYQFQSTVSSLRMIGLLANRGRLLVEYKPAPCHGLQAVRSHGDEVSLGLGCEMSLISEKHQNTGSLPITVVTLPYRGRAFVYTPQAPCHGMATWESWNLEIECFGVFH
jgi:hypothetical protein